MAAAGKGVGGNQIGFRLLDYRSNIKKNELVLKEIMALKEETQKDWEHLKQLAQQRTIQTRKNDNLKPRKKRAIDEKCDGSPCRSKRIRA